MSKNKVIRSALLLALLGPFAIGINAQTIEELTNAGRAKKMIELRTTNGAPMANLQHHANGDGNSQAIGDRNMVKKRNINAEPVLMSIYGIGSNLVAEIAENDVPSKYAVNDKTASGWTVGSIQKRSVTLKKLDKKGKTLATKTLAFWDGEVRDVTAPSAPIATSSTITPARTHNAQMPMPR